MKKLFIVAGEASGDLHAANLVRELRQTGTELDILGMGGERMREQGVNTLVDIADMGVVGIAEVLFSYKRLKAVLERIKQQLEQEQPDLLLLVDYQEFNQRLAAHARTLGIKVLFYISPQFWAWRPNRVYRMAELVDHMAVIFPFEVEPYEQAGVPVSFPGHPLVDEIQPDKTPAEARAALGQPQALTIGLFPGSRKVEIARLLPIQLKAAERLRQHYPGCRFLLPRASTIKDEVLLPYEAQLQALDVAVISNHTHDVIQACDAIMVTSGTATLEIGLFARPMVIMHKVSMLSYFILRPLIKLEHIGLVNIVPGKEIVKEFIQHEATVDNIVNEMRHIIDDDDYRQHMCEQLAGLRGLLGDGGGSEKMAQLVLDLMEHA